MCLHHKVPHWAVICPLCLIVVLYRTDISGVYTSDYIVLCLSILLRTYLCCIVFCVFSSSRIHILKYLQYNYAIMVPQLINHIIVAYLQKSYCYFQVIYNTTQINFSKMSIKLPGTKMCVLESEECDEWNRDV